MQNKIYKYMVLPGFLVWVSLAHTGCKSGKNLGGLNTDTSGLYRTEEDITDTTSIANLSWSEYFSDDQLKSLIEEGLANNLDMKVAMERINQSQSGLKMAKAALYPTLNAGGQMEYTRFSAGDRGKDVLGYEANNITLGLSTSWEIDVWGKLNSRKKAQLAAYLNSQEYAVMVQTNLVAGIANYYYTLTALDEQLRITEETIKLLSENAVAMQALKEAGMQNGAAVEQSNALLYSTQLSVPELKSQIREVENAMCVLLGRKPREVQRNTIGMQQVPDEMQYGVPSQLLARRPDVKQAELSFRMAYELTNAAQASLYPSFTISSGSLGYSNSTFSDLFSPENIAANIIGGITQPIFNNRQLRSNLEIAKSQQREAALTFENTLLTAGQEVSDVLFGFKASLAKNELRGKQIASLTTAVDFTNDLLMAGEANYLEVLTAQRSLLTAQLNRISDKLEQLNYCVSLYKALGGGSK
ncbi:efflux transporter outer membrane subunit [Carboxylicivirga linearis]|uniref:Efflux transporter outer membrane subunit n=1 Tax=Carboxylicivirga linearis TaxID=1628157 RepID=A0ABS5K0B3_9BACT|nr:efflux transporter outer membrane subunit [Carboxylicivirga linearis]MBS2100553.1 efflux transporter outer membrane subunit [Carboxylicivirga linearis]